MIVFLSIALLANRTKVLANAAEQPDSLLVKKSIHWVNFPETDSLLKTKPKKVFITLYTNWCKWCKKLEGEVLSDSVLSGYMNEHYYAIHFNAESKEDISFFGQTFTYDPIAKVHGLALVLMEGEIGYPSSFILNEELELLQPIKGYVTKEEIIPILKFYGDNFYKTMSWDNFTSGK